MSELSNRISTLISTLKIKKITFAERLKVSQAFVSQLCSGVKQPSDRTISDICREFNVSEEWLRTGDGEMFADVPVEDEYFKAATQISKSGDKFAMQAIIEYWKLDDVSKEVLKDYIYKIAKKSRE